ncbi:MAG: glycosyltransferase family 2 protein [Lachnospiraceae bacterium]|nr:glycosyltransferase family 2 protein [Lachnospiraceae bacterium]
MSNRTCVVIPNFNGKEYMADCLMALRMQTLPPDEIIVVDNGSTDGSADLVAGDFPEVRLVRLEENTGFCGGVNTGIRMADEDGMDYVILLNSDTRADPRFVEELVRAMDVNQQTFSCQAKMISMRDPGKMDDGGDLYCSFGWAFARGKGRSSHLFRKPAEIFSACAGAAIYRMSILREIGLFDENHFAYLEDTDIGWRARIHGYENLYIPSSRVLHVGSAASGSVYNLFKVKNTSRNSIYLISKNMPPFQIFLNFPFLFFGFAVKAVFFTRKGFGREYLHGILDGFRLSRRGKAEGRHVPYDPVNFPNYVKLQVEMWINMFRRLLNV